MKNLLSRLILTTFISTAIFLAVPLPAFAASNLYLSPATLTVGQNATFSVGVRENSGSTKVNAVQANLSYPADRLDCLGFSIGSVFNLLQIHNAWTSCSGGSITIVEGVTGAGVSGDNLVATINFKSKTTPGSAQVNFVSGSAVVRSTPPVCGADKCNDLSSSSGGTYTVNAPVCKTADLNCDGVVNIRDASILISKWETNDSGADLNHDGIVNIRDASILISRWEG